MKTLKRKLDALFSRFIRLRDADENGICRCISCGKHDHWKNMDAGHYINRRHLSVRWNEKNVNVQCRGCNRFDEGNVLGYTRGLVKKYGSGILDELELQKYLNWKPGTLELQVMTDDYKQKLKNALRLKQPDRPTKSREKICSAYAGRSNY